MVEYKAKDMQNHDLYNSNDEMFEIKQYLDDGFVLSNLNNKSSVLCPKSQDITSQYMALQQLDAHRRMISRAKGCIDTSPPKSLQSYRSAADRKKKSLWQRLPNESRPTSITNLSLSDIQHLEKSPRPYDDRCLEENDDESLNASSLNKGIQTGMPFSAFSSTTADKISWYLEAISQGELQSQFLMYRDSPGSTSFHSMSRNSQMENSNRKKVIKGDIMEWHKSHFVKSSKPFSPRILANTNAESKVKSMRCYNSPQRKKKNHSTNSSDTFESYEEDFNDAEFEEGESEGAESEKPNEDDSTRIETAHTRTLSESRNAGFNPTKSSRLEFQYENYLDLSTPLEVLNKNEEDKYLNFLSKVTEDILRSGVYTNRAIQRAFEFHMQFHNKDVDRDKLQQLLEQVLEGLQVSNDETDDILMRRDHLSTLESLSLSRPNTPPVKENLDILSGSADRLRTMYAESDLRSSDVGDQTPISLSNNVGFSEGTIPDAGDLKSAFESVADDS